MAATATNFVIVVFRKFVVFRKATTFPVALSSQFFFYPRDAMLARSLLSRGVRLSSHAGIVSKRIKISSNFFLGLVAPTTAVFNARRYA